MMSRLASSTPPPLWQALLSIAIGIAAAVCGHLVRGQGLQDRTADARQAAELATLVRWARAA